MRLRGRVRPQILDARSGAVLHDLGWRQNLILNGGLDMVASYVFADCFKYGHLGSGSAPVQPADIGLQNWARRTSTYGAGDVAAIYVGDVATLQRSFLFAAETGAVTYNEFGSSPTNVDRAPLFNRVVFDNPLTLGNGQQAKITMALDITVSPLTTPQVYSSDVITGWAGSTGQARVTGHQFYTVSTYEYDVRNFAWINADGLSQIGTYSGRQPMLEPSMASTAGDNQLFASNATTLQGGVEQHTIAYSNGATSYVRGGTLSLQGYTPGSYSRVRTGVADLNDLNLAGIRSVGLTNYVNLSGYWKAPMIYQFVMDNAFTKANTHRLTLNFTYTWGRA
jgi:hypothetical protein